MPMGSLNQNVTQFALTSLAMLMNRVKGALLAQQSVMSTRTTGKGWGADSYGRTDVWWNRASARGLLAATEFIERSSAPLVVSSNSDGHSMGTVMSLAHASSDRSRFLLVVEPEMPVIPDEFEDVFLWSVSEAMLDRLTDSGWRVQEVDAPDLHRLSRPNVEIAAGSPPVW